MDVIDVVGVHGRLIQIDGDRIARIIRDHGLPEDKASKATMKIIAYLIEVIAKANEGPH